MEIDQAKAIWSRYDKPLEVCLSLDAPAELLEAWEVIHDHLLQQAMNELAGVARVRGQQVKYIPPNDPMDEGDVPHRQ